MNNISGNFVFYQKILFYMIDVPIEFFLLFSSPPKRNQITPLGFISSYDGACITNSSCSICVFRLAKEIALL